MVTLTIGTPGKDNNIDTIKEDTLIDFNDIKVSELKEIAKERDIKGCSNMNKKELIEALEGD